MQLIDISEEDIPQDIKGRVSGAVKGVAEMADGDLRVIGHVAVSLAATVCIHSPFPYSALMSIARSIINALDAISDIGPHGTA